MIRLWTSGKYSLWCAWYEFSVLFPLNQEVGDVYMGFSLFFCGVSLEDVADCDVYFCGGEFLFPFFVAVNVWECDGLASCEDGEFLLGELGFTSSGEP